jgi:cytidylate kinase
VRDLLAKFSIIAIDGTAASGKSTVGAALAQRLGYLFFDTGVMYRAVTWAVLERNIEVHDIAQVSKLAELLVIDVTPDGEDDGRQATVLVDGRDVTWEIRRPEVDQAVSQISSYPRVRVALTAQQRRIAAIGSIVMVGRDIGTVVLPEADLKIFMIASPQERARRRYQDTIAQGYQANYNEILAAIIERDEKDRTNPVSPMVPAHDAVIIETDQLSVEAILDKLEQLMERS